jgi:hypothetical protein
VVRAVPNAQPEEYVLDFEEVLELVGALDSGLALLPESDFSEEDPEPFSEADLAPTDSLDSFVSCARLRVP